MRLDIITLFPGICSPLQESILGRAGRRGLADIRVTDLRQFAEDRHRTTDEPPYGGGAGMVIKADIVRKAVTSVRTPEAKVILLTPQGRPLTQALAGRLAEEKHLVLLCGHYEGVDERIAQSWIDEEISIGDYILTNGTLAALVVADAVVRLVPGVLGAAASAEEESFTDERLLEYPHYTRPEEDDGATVPPALLSGNHHNIEAWRRELRFLRTLSRRPDLFEQGMEKHP